MERLASRVVGEQFKKPGCEQECCVKRIAERAMRFFFISSWASHISLGKEDPAPR